MIEAVEFTKWPSIQRERNLFIVAEEKIDGTNAALHIRDGMIVGIQSRKRMITTESDNFGFARWARLREPELVTALGDGLHFGEFWGSGIQRGYDLMNGEKRFSLFNSARWSDAKDHFESLDIGLSVVPKLFHGKAGSGGIEQVRERSLLTLQEYGSFASPGFRNPEGLIIHILDFNARIKVIPDGWEPDSKAATRG